MKPFLPKIASAPQQRGLSVITGVFLLLLMAVLAAGIVSLVSATNRNLAADIGGSRAYQAARAGAEWAMYSIEILDPTAASVTPPACVSGTPAVPGHTVTVGCVSSDYVEAGRNIRIYRITSNARANGAVTPGIEREVQVTLEKCRDANKSVAPFDC